MDKSAATELTNKLRWAIGTSLKARTNGDFSMVFREQMWLASLITDEVQGVLSALNHVRQPIDRKLLKNLLTQIHYTD